MGRKQSEKSRAFKWYGKRGICICEEWSRFLNFRHWALNNGYHDNLTIDRINVNGNYEPNNCRWITIQEQQKKSEKMNLIILGSSSKGNCYLLDNGKECLMIECGVAFKDVQKAVNFDISRICGVLVSHEHGDHAKHVKKCLESRIPVYASQGTLNAIGITPTRDVPNLVCRMGELTIQQIGKFRVQPFATQHDAAEPFGFLIYHPECGMVLFATDTYYLHYTFAGLNNILIECNYRQDILDANVEAGLLPKALRARTIKSHMEFDTCKETLLANDLSGVNNIVLIHLSDGNSNASEFRQGIMEETGKTVYIAESGMTINFNKTPF